MLLIIGIPFNRIFRRQPLKRTGKNTEYLNTQFQGFNEMVYLLRHIFVREMRRVFVYVNGGINEMNEIPVLTKLF